MATYFKLSDIGFTDEEIPKYFAEAKDGKNFAKDIHICFNCIISSISGNCGMRQLTNFTVAVAGVSVKGHLDEFYKVLRDKMVANPAVTFEVFRSLGINIGLIVLSDRIMELRTGSGTWFLMALLASGKFGMVVSSPTVKNNTYGDGSHGIRAMFWMPGQKISNVYDPRVTIVGGDTIFSSVPDVAKRQRDKNPYYEEIVGNEPFDPTKPTGNGNGTGRGGDASGPAVPPVQRRRVRRKVVQPYQT